MSEPVFPNPNDVVYQNKPMEQILDECFWVGVNEGWQNMGARAISDYVEPQQAYFDGYIKGKKDCERARKIAERDFPGVNGMNKVMARAFDNWVETYEE